MIEKIKNYSISVCEASRGGIKNLPLVDIKNIVGFDTDTYFKKNGQNKIRKSIDLILFTSKKRYFIEFKSGDDKNIDPCEIKDKITFTMLKYFGDGDEKIFDSKKNNCFYLVIRGIDELELGINMSSMKSSIENPSENPSKVNLEKIDNVIKEFEGFCYQKAEILKASGFINRINEINNKEKFIVNF